MDMYLKDFMGLTSFEDEESDELSEIEYIDGKFCKTGYPADEVEEEYEYNEDKCTYQKIKRVWDW